LETWLESTKGEDNNDDLIEKREEYRGLIEETILLQRKLRKTLKLLSSEKSEKMLQKLSKKQDQYLGEIDEIMNYAETDVLFETAEIEPNELLGEPLETLMEQPGLEGSSSSLLNFTMDDYMPNTSKVTQLSPSDQVDELEPIKESNGTSFAPKYNESSATVSTGGSTSLFTASTANSSTFNYDVRTLRKKLKKVERLLAAGEISEGNNEPLKLDSIQMKKLRKKREQYTQALQYNLKNGTPSSPMENDNQDHGFDPLRTSPNDVEKRKLQEYPESEEEHSEEEIEYIEEEIIEEEIVEEYEIEEYEEFGNAKYHDSPVNDIKSRNSILYDRKTLKKKLKKLKKMMEVTSDPTELEVLKQKKREYKMALQAMKEKESGIEQSSRSRSSSSQHELVETDEIAPIEPDTIYTKTSQSARSQSRHENFPSEANDDQIELLKKKLRKANKAIDKARKEGDPKKLKKMEKKRLEYQNTLKEILS